MDPTHDVRPRLRADALFTATDDGVLLQYPEGQFVLKGRTAYQWMCRLAPHLTGAHTLAELCHGLSEERRATVTAMVRTLLRSGVVRDVRGDDSAAHSGSSLLPEAVRVRFRDQLAYLDHQLGGADADSAFARFRATRVLIAGSGEAAESCAVTLLRNGLRTVTLSGPYEEPPSQLLRERDSLRGDGCDAHVTVRPPGEHGGTERTATGGDPDGDERAGVDLVVACGTDHRELARHNRAALAGGPALLPLTVLDGTAVLGPLVHGGRHDDGGSGDSGGTGGGEQVAGCWQCAVLRLAANLEPTAAAALLRAVHTERPAAGPDAQLGRMLGTTLAFDVFRHRTGALHAETAGALVTQDCATLATSREPLLAHPDCAACGEVPHVPGAEVPHVPGAVSEHGAREAGETPSGPGPAGEETLFGTYAGVFRRYADDALPQSPLRAACVEVTAPGPSAVSPRTVTAFALDTHTEARAAARTSAALVYEALLHTHGLPRSAAPYIAHGSEERVPGAELTNWSGTGGTGESAEPDGSAAEAPWLRAWVWDSPEPASAGFSARGRTVAVPAAAVHPGGAVNRDRRFEPGSAGAGAGATVAAAARAGLLSALAYEGVVAALRGEVAARPLTVDTAADEDCGFLLRSVAHFDRQVTLLELPGAAPAHAVAALAGDAVSTGVTHALGYGTTRTEATVHALRDLVGTLQLAQAGRPVDLGDPLVYGLGAQALAATVQDPARPAPPAGQGPTASVTSGRAALVVVTTPPDLRAGGVETVRVLLRRPREEPA
ncbi:TOMM precursor leader peptide-binding protein [Streptomyces sp. CA-250714]|uniref:TOMM precursor leader peptide-binding protein n=1 Tax=Streptomyces sp. CA-250714 TaxID=3240060 RepID=UPI003D8E518B